MDIHKRTIFESTNQTGNHWKLNSGPLAWAAMSTTEVSCMAPCAWRRTNIHYFVPSFLSVRLSGPSFYPSSFPLSSLLSKQRYGWGPSLTEPKIWGGGAGPIPDWHQASSTECDGALSEPLLQWCCPASANCPHGTLWASTWKRTIPGQSTCKLVTRDIVREGCSFSYDHMVPTKESPLCAS